jgi:formate/nitrite transporter FocA (FNT family)
MPDRAIIPLIAALAGGFITGVITAVTQTYSPQTLIIGLIVGVFVFAAGFVSVIRAEGEEQERWIVGALRGLVAAATFGFLYVGLLIAVRDGNIVGLLFLLLAAVFAVLLTRFRVRDRGQLDEYGGRGQPAA